MTRISALPNGSLHSQDGATPRRAEWSDTAGLIAFDRGRCNLRATADELILLTEADDQQELRLLQDAIAARVSRIGRRDQLSLTWRPESGAPGRPNRSIDALMHHLMTPAGRADPFPIYAEIHQLGPVVASGDRSFVVCGYEAVNQVLREPGFGVPGTMSSFNGGHDASPLMNRSILRTDPPDHGRMRSLISRAFTPRQVSALRPTIERAVDDLLRQLAAAAQGGAADAMSLVAFPLPVTVICELLGIPPDDRQRFRPLAADLTQALELSGDMSVPAVAAAQQLSEYLAPLIQQRRTTPRDDLVSALIKVRDADDGRLSDQELLANLILLLVAGFETTTNLLGNGLAILLNRPDLVNGLRSGRLPIGGFVEEVLRYDSPVQVVTRWARHRGLSVGGVGVPEGANLILIIGAANRDPARYANPDRFDPTRSDIRPLSFGAGAHVCIGNSLARLEADVAFSALLNQFPKLSTAPGQSPLRRDRLVLRGFQTLPVQV